jgi:heme O synthase-like polyprenyltransferase
MWRGLLGLDEQTRAEKRAAISGINLFFGALIGANLGSLERLALRDYLLLIIIVSLIVLYIQVAPVARKRWSYLMTLIGTVAGLAVLLLTPVGLDVFENRPRPSPHLFVTIALWLLSVAMVELRPIAATTPPD